MTKIIALVPCRAGSQRVIEKNTRAFGGKDLSLIKIKITQLLKVPEISEIIVSTDDPKIIETAESFKNKKIKVNKMDSRYTQNLKTNDELVGYIASMIKEGDHLLWTHVTSPFITEETYSRAIKEYLENLGKYDSLVSVKKIKSYVWDEDRKVVSHDIKKEGRWPKTQNIKALYHINSGIFLIPIPLLKSTNDRVGKNPYFFECNDVENLDVDWLEDFHLADTLWKALSKFKETGL